MRINAAYSVIFASWKWFIFRDSFFFFFQSVRKTKTQQICIHSRMRAKTQTELIFSLFLAHCSFILLQLFFCFLEALKCGLSSSNCSCSRGSSSSRNSSSSSGSSVNECIFDELSVRSFAVIELVSNTRICFVVSIERKKKEKIKKSLCFTLVPMHSRNVWIIWWKM